MQRAGRLGLGWGLAALGVLGPASGGRAVAQTAMAPAAPSYAAALRTIDTVRNGWSNGAPAEAAGWYTYFDNVRNELGSYAAAKTWADQLAAIERVQSWTVKLDGVAGWAPAGELRAALSDWAAPRLRLARAERQLSGVLAATGSADDANRKDWATFVDEKLGGPLRGFEAAKTVQERQEAGTRLHVAVESLRKSASWPYAAELLAAADALFNGPNIDVSADVASLSPVLSAQVVSSGPIYRGGYVSQVTAGPYAGFGLLACDQGLAFTNSQYLTSVTPITDFERQVESDPKGRRAAKLYHFSATSTDSGLLTVTAILTPFGVQLQPGNSHNIDARICSAPTPGKGLTRGIASLIGMNQQKITDKVYDQAIGRIKQQVAQGAADEAAERSAAAQNEQNAKIHNALPGDGTARVKEIAIAGLSLRSRPTNALIGGTVMWAGVPVQVGADVPQPPKFAAPAPGISADVHLASVATNVAGGFLQSPEAAGVENLMFEVRKPAPGTKPADAVKISKNVDFPAYLKRVEALTAENDPGAQVIRIRKPARAPEFAVDARGFLVVIAHDLQIDLPVPAQLANSPLGGAKAKVYRLDAKTAEFVFEIKPVTQPDGSIRLTGNLKEFNTAPGSRVLAINDDEARALPIDPFRSVLIFQGFANAIRAKPLDVPLQNLKMPGYVITSISDLDPSGWMRIVLTPTGERPLPPVATAATPTPAPASATVASTASAR
jgi:hypothetical protein